MSLAESGMRRGKLVKNSQPFVRAIDPLQEEFEQMQVAPHRASVAMFFDGIKNSTQGEELPGIFFDPHPRSHLQSEWKVSRSIALLPFQV